MSSLLDFDFLLKAVQGSCLQKGFDSFNGVATDSRKSATGKVFFALKGSHFDGHDFLNQALEKGVEAFVISEKEKAEGLLNNKSNTLIYVSDTLKALQNLAQFWTKKMSTKIVAITGSNGKTTTRAFTQTLFSGLSPFASPKSYNNHVGVPLSLLNVDRKGAFLIQEIGSSRPGEIAFLTSLCDPVISTVTMVGPSHLEGLGSIDLIAQEKQQIYLKSQKAFWIFNRDNFYTDKMFQKLGASHPSVLTFSSRKKDTDVHLYFLKEEAQSSVIGGQIASVRSEAKVAFSGNHNLENLMCACALALGAGIDPQEIWNLIPKCRTISGRQQWIHLKDKNISILFDAYNANPSSMDSFFKSCEKFSRAGKCLFVIGDMKELGKDSVRYHTQLASQPVLLKSRFVVFVGKYASLVEEQLKQKGFKGQFIGSKTYDRQILSAVKNELKKEDMLAIKASRSLKLEQLLCDLTGVQNKSF